MKYLYYQNDLKCTVCKSIVTLIDSELKKNSSHGKINETVYKFCETLSGSIKLLVITVITLNMLILYGV